MVDNTIALQVKPLDIATPLMQAAKMRQMESEQQRLTEADNREQVASAMRGLAPYADSPEFAGRWAQTVDDLGARGHMRPDIVAKMRTNPSVMAMHSVLAQSEDPKLTLQKQQLAETTRQHGATIGMQEKQLVELGRHHGAIEAFKKAEAEAAVKGIDYREIDDGEGGKVLVKINKANGTVERMPIGGQPEDPKSPYAPTQKLTSDESNARSYATRMIDAHNTIANLEDINSGAKGFLEGTAAGRPMVRDNAGFNLVASADRQKSIQAQRNFINAILRKESGAAIGKDEFDNAQRQYFPQPGAGSDVIAQKRKNRMTAIEGMMQAAGRGFKPPDDYIGTKGPSSIKATMSAARDAIAKGAPRDKVEQRLKESGIKFQSADLD